MRALRFLLSTSLQPWVSESETEPELAQLDSASSLAGPGSPPVFKAQLRSLHVQEGADGILQASIVGNPKPRVRRDLPRK